MQAPTTPSGSTPAQDPGDRACPHCGASNGRLAAFCWQCYRPFAATAGAGAGRPGVGPGAYGGGARGPVGIPAPLSTPPTTSRGGRLTGVLVIVLALVVAAGVYVVMNAGSGAELPASFGGLTKIEDEQVEAALEFVRSQGDAQGLDTDMGLYGSGAVPTAALAWVSADGQSIGGDPFADVEAGLPLGTPGAIDRSRVATRSSDGITFSCAPFEGPQPANLCLWQSADTVWVLVDFSGSDMAATQTLAVAANAAA